MKPPAKLSPAPVGSTTSASGIGGHDERLLAAEEHRAVLPLLDDDELRPELEDLLAGADEVDLVGEHPRLAVVEDQAVDLAEQGVQLVALGLDPEVHRVGDDELRLLRLRQDLALGRGVAVGEEDERRRRRTRARARG